MCMKKVSVVELKARLSKYLSMVQEGETVYITSHRRPVARLSPSQLDDSLQVRPPDHGMEELRRVPGLKPAPGRDGVEELIEERRRR